VQGEVGKQRADAEVFGCIDKTDQAHVLLALRRSSR